MHRKLLASLCLAGAVALPHNAHAGDVNNASYVTGLQQTPMLLVMDQTAVEALYAGINGNATPTLTPAYPMSWSGIGVNVAGGALGMAFVSAAEKAGNHKFAEQHIARLREVSKGSALPEQLQQAVLESTRDIAWLEGGTTQVVADAKKTEPSQDITSWVTIHPRFALSTDFSHVVVLAEVELFHQQVGGSSDWRHKPVFHNTLVFQSQSLHIADKTPADTERMIAEENAQWNQPAIDAEIDDLNKQPRFDATVAKRRRALVDRIEQHKKNLVAAKSPAWDASQLAYEYARAWGDHDAVALKQALHDGGIELGKMLALTFSGRHDNVDMPPGDTASAASDEAPKRLDYLQPNGDVMSILGNDKLMVGPYFTGS
ncbi:hypothetical protein [Dyella amyloliquefaciens]|uniref:hypothetical protein n=1 Tax=Dyella amyloliquefaciens TaxID=1770545 RepID=UPI00102E4FF7|nr:hypothetical protein [Dyella amyloliquefaciens]